MGAETDQGISATVLGNIYCFFTVEWYWYVVQTGTNCTSRARCTCNVDSIWLELGARKWPYTDSQQSVITTIKAKRLLGEITAQFLADSTKV